MDCATGSALQRKDLPARESKQTQTQTRLLSDLTLLPPQETEERSWDRTRVKNQREERDCIPPALDKCLTSSGSTDEVQIQNTDSVAGITLQLLQLRGMLWLLTT